MDHQYFTYRDKKFTLREMQVISILVHGLKLRQSAAYLGCEEGTVKTHIKNIRNKLGPSLEVMTCRRMIFDARGSFDLKGKFGDKYLFDNSKEILPWHMPPDAIWPNTGQK